MRKLDQVFSSDGHGGFDGASAAFDEGLRSVEVAMSSPIAAADDEAPNVLDRLPPREREVAIVVYRRGSATANDVCERLSDPISNAAVRSMLTRLVAKGVLVRRREGKRFHYLPAQLDDKRESALRRLSREHFGGSLSRTAAAVAMLIVADAAQL